MTVSSPEGPSASSDRETNSTTIAASKDILSFFALHTPVASFSQKSRQNNDTITVVTTVAPGGFDSEGIKALGGFSNQCVH